MNAKRTVRGFAQAGFAGVLIEDQAWPKACGHVKERRVVSRCVYRYTERAGSCRSVGTSRGLGSGFRDYGLGLELGFRVYLK